MSIRIRRCLVIVCDGCGETADHEDLGTPHFDHLGEAEELLHSDDSDDGYGWLMTPTEHVCPRCRAKRACALVGHDWDEWRSVNARGIPMLARMCWRCPEREITPDAGVRP
jgi:hypothetical protein